MGFATRVPGPCLRLGTCLAHCRHPGCALLGPWKALDRLLLLPGEKNVWLGRKMSDTGLVTRQL